jgi:IS1 family transposase
MNILPFEKQVHVISSLTEGCSIRATERLTGVHRDTIMRLGVRIGEGCNAIHDRLFRNLNVPLIELDEVWSFVGKKQRRVTPEDGAGMGDAYVFTALDSVHKGLLAYRVGKRTLENTSAFAADLRGRILNRPQISSDGFPAYPEAIEQAFGMDCHYGQIIKQYVGEPPKDAARRYSPGVVVGVRKEIISGSPVRANISTSRVERSNLTVRMQSRRFTRLTNGFSKKLENHKAAVALYVAYYNLCRVHETIRCTPAMALGVTSHIWSIGELIEIAERPEALPERVAPFTVINGGIRD